MKRRCRLSRNPARVQLRHGADVNAHPGRDAGATALQYAAIQGRIQVVLMLLRAGANIIAPPALKRGRTAFEVAAENGRLDTLQLLQNAASGQGILEEMNIGNAIEAAKRTGEHILVKYPTKYAKRD
jgi:ankyrin repeat protein